MRFRYAALLASTTLMVLAWSTAGHAGDLYVGPLTPEAEVCWLIRSRPGREAGLLGLGRGEKLHRDVVHAYLRENRIEVLAYEQGDGLREPGAVLVFGTYAKIDEMCRKLKRHLTDEERITNLQMEVTVRWWTDKDGQRVPDGPYVYPLNRPGDGRQGPLSHMIRRLRVLREFGPAAMFKWCYLYPDRAVEADRFSWEVFLPLEDRPLIRGRDERRFVLER